MGQTTPNIGIYIPAAGETNYDASFAAGMINIDQHDHSGGPNKGVPITATGIADGSITFEKLNANVADTTTGIGTNTGPLANQLIILGLLASIFNIPQASGFVAKDGTNATARTLTSANANITITNPAGIAGNPQFALAAIPDVTGINAPAGTLTLGVSGFPQLTLVSQYLQLANGINNVAIASNRVATGGIAPAASANVTGFILGANQMYIAVSVSASGLGSGVGQIALVGCGANLAVEATVSNVFASPNPTFAVDTGTGQVALTNNAPGAGTFNISWLRLY